MQGTFSNNFYVLSDVLPLFKFRRLASSMTQMPCSQ